MKIVFGITTLLCLLVFCMVGCQSKSKSSESKYLRRVGDILPDAQLDDSTFVLCRDLTAVQYFSFGEKTFEGEKILIERTFEAQYDADKAAKESGLIRVRFVVNCKGETGRYRIMGMNKDYQEKEFDKSITDQLLTITQSLKGWKTFPDKNRDYYQYLIFKIKDGELLEIMP